MPTVPSRGSSTSAAAIDPEMLPRLARKYAPPVRRPTARTRPRKSRLATGKERPIISVAGSRMAAAMPEVLASRHSQGRTRKIGEKMLMRSRRAGSFSSWCSMAIAARAKAAMANWQRASARSGRSRRITGR